MSFKLWSVDGGKFYSEKMDGSSTCGRSLKNIRSPGYSFAEPDVNRFRAPIPVGQNED